MSTPDSSAEVIVRGISASPGIAYGPVFVYHRAALEVPVYEVDPIRRAAEEKKFDDALVRTRAQITAIRDEVEAKLGPDEAHIFDAHLMVLDDPALMSETLRELETTGRNVAACFEAVAQRYIAAFDRIDDEYLRERAGDIRDVSQRVLHNLLGVTAQNFAELLDKRVIVAEDILPSDTAGLDRSSALGVITAAGSKTSHAVIVARSMRIPAVVAARDILELVGNGDDVIVDGYDGVVIIRPSPQTLYSYGQLREEKQVIERRLMDAVHEPSVTTDGHAVPLRANIEKEDETDLVKEYAGEGVGLFRSEYLFLASPTLPTEEEQYLAYRAVAEAFPREGVTIRTLDLGGDKPMTGAPHLFPRESNPFLGFRAIRFCLKHRDIFRTQLRAILRASAHGKVELMFPMISGTAEMLEARAVLDECRDELRLKGVAFDEAMPIGSMIEIPSAALTADKLARHCDFFSIGTNDLIQYLIAIDRLNDRTAHLYEPTHPAVIRVLKEVVDHAHAAGIKVGVCGEMAGDPLYVPLLIGLGVDELSMTPPLLPAVKFMVRATSRAEAQALVKKVLTLDTAQEIFERCADGYRRAMATAQAG